MVGILTGVKGGNKLLRFNKLPVKLRVAVGTVKICVALPSFEPLGKPEVRELPF